MRTLLLFPLLLLAAGCGGVPSVPPAAKKAAYPYPECEEFLKRIKDESGEPDRVEVVKWVARFPSIEPKGLVTLVAMVRDTNKLGAREVTERRATLPSKSHR